MMGVWSRPQALRIDSGNDGMKEANGVNSPGEEPKAWDEEEVGLPDRQRIQRCRRPSELFFNGQS